VNQLLADSVGGLARMLPALKVEDVARRWVENVARLFYLGYLPRRSARSG